MTFLDRVQQLPVLGIGVSTEYGAGDSPGGLDLAQLRSTAPRFGRFLEVGVEVAKGLDRHALDWVAAGGPTTYHFLDVNLDEAEDFDPAWLAEVRGIVSRLRPAWMCGDAGLWHFGRRERGHMLLLPPILTDDSARAQAEGLVALREATGLEVLPENPPGTVFVGDLHLLEFFARVCDYADTGMVLDVAHLAIYQRVMGHGALDGLADLPLDRVVECHVAGGIERQTDGWPWIEDDHAPQVLPDTWRIFETVAPRAENLKGVIFEAERNPLADCLPGFRRIAEITAGTPVGAA